MVNLWEQQILWIHQIFTKHYISKHYKHYKASVSWFSASSTELLAEHPMIPDQWSGQWAHWSHPAHCCQFSSMAAPQQIMIFLGHAAKPAPDFWSSQHQCKHNAGESPWLLLPKMSLKLIQPVGLRLREQEAWPKHHHWASNLPQLGKRRWYRIQKRRAVEATPAEVSAVSEPCLWRRDLLAVEKYRRQWWPLKEFKGRGLSNLLTQWTNFMASPVGKEQQITLSNLLCDRPGIAFRS